MAPRDLERLEVGTHVLARTKTLGWRLCQVAEVRRRTVLVRLPLGQLIERKARDVKERES